MQSTHATTTRKDVVSTTDTCRRLLVHRRGHYRARHGQATRAAGELGRHRREGSTNSEPDGRFGKEAGRVEHYGHRVCPGRRQGLGQRRPRQPRHPMYRVERTNRSPGSATTARFAFMCFARIDKSLQLTLRSIVSLARRLNSRYNSIRACSFAHLHRDGRFLGSCEPRYTHPRSRSAGVA